MSKDIPILFSTPMVQAILEGRKTMTRRIINPAPVIDEENGYVYMNNHKLQYDIHDWKNLICEDSKWQPGTKLWVRETWQHTKCLNISPDDENYGYVYKADNQPWKDMEGWIWKPSIFMPRAASRITLEITEVRVERLHDITEQDAISEGIERIKDQQDPWAYRSYHTTPEKQLIPCAPFVSFRTLWQTINGTESWNSNPFVWVIVFKKC